MGAGVVVWDAVEMVSVAGEKIEEERLLSGRLMYNFCTVANNLLTKTEWDALH